MFLKEFTNTEINSLKVEFKNLLKLSDKLAFWEEKLKYPYYLNYKLPQTEISHFIINPSKKEDKEQLNQLILKEVRLKKIFKISDSEIYQSELLKKLIDIKKPVPILEKELNKVKAEISLEEKNHKEENIINASQYVKAGFFLHGYETSYLKEMELDFSNQIMDAPNLAALVNGYELGKYQIFLEQKIKNPSIKNFSESHSETSLKQQVLILHYLGILDSIKTEIGNDKNHLISKLLNRSQSKVKSTLTYLGRNSEHNSMTPANLEMVIELLEKTGFNAQAEKAKADLNKQVEIKK